MRRNNFCKMRERDACAKLKFLCLTKQSQLTYRCKIKIESIKRILHGCKHREHSNDPRIVYDLSRRRDNRITILGIALRSLAPILFGSEPRNAWNGFQSHASRHLSRRRGHFIPVRWNFSSRRHLDQYLRSRDWGPRHSTFRDHMRTRPRTLTAGSRVFARTTRRRDTRSSESGAYVAHDSLRSPDIR